VQVRGSNFVELIYAALAEGGAVLLGGAAQESFGARETVNPHTCLPALIGSGFMFIPRFLFLPLAKVFC
jgi:hypothetical protein